MHSVYDCNSDDDWEDDNDKDFVNFVGQAISVVATIEYLLPLENQWSCF